MLLEGSVTMAERVLALTSSDVRADMDVLPSTEAASVEGRPGVCLRVGMDPTWYRNQYGPPLFSCLSACTEGDVSVPALWQHTPL